MKRKYIILAAACSFLLIAGICYSCAYKPASNDTTLQLSDQQEKDWDGASKQENSAPDDTSEHYSDTGKTDETENSEPIQGKDMDTVVSVSENAVELSSNYVHICGAVKHPGVYQSKADSRLIDLVEQAGGFTDKAAEDYINQASKVQDGQRIYIPTEEEVKELSAGERMDGDSTEETTTQASPESSGSKLININTATAEELMELPGVGEAKAASIIDYRNTKGKFKSIEDLMKISGIKEGLFQKVSKYITVN